MIFPYQSDKGTGFRFSLSAWRLPKELLDAWTSWTLGDGIPQVQLLQILKKHSGSLYLSLAQGRSRYMLIAGVWWTLPRLLCIILIYASLPACSSTDLLLCLSHVFIYFWKLLWYISIYYGYYMGILLLFITKKLLLFVIQWLYSLYHNLSLGIFSEPLAQVKIPKMPMAKRSRRCWTGKIGDTTTGPWEIMGWDDTPIGWCDPRVLGSLF